ncbi:alpha/beta hydrolase [Corynebacterium aurimucosum]
MKLLSALLSSALLMSSAPAYQESSRHEQSSRWGVDATFSILNAMGSSSHLLTDLFTSEQEGYPYPVDASISTASVVSRAPTDEPGREKWLVASPSMGREIPVDVVLGSGGPVVYFLEGVDSPETSNWITKGHLKRVFGDSDASIVIPSQGAGSMWTDWNEDDPKLGRHKWNTFVTQELAPVVEAELNHNGKRGIIGLSMGASGAVMMANNHPGFFDAVAGISGCYSTTSTVGQGTVDLTVGSLGGNPRNMWGPHGSPDWLRNDVMAHPEGLRGTTLYLSAATGAWTDEEMAAYPNKSLDDRIGGTLLEAGSKRCTEEFSAALDDASLPHTTDYLDAGVHDWVMFGKQLQPAWDAIKPALY